jgi:hypothetical protein
MTADRIHYWKQSGDLDGLQSVLKNQLIGYCNNSPSDESIPAECKVILST